MAVKPNKVLIATPTAGQTVANAYVKTVISAIRAITRRGMTYAHELVDGADVVMARNLLANHALRDKDVSHLLFLDSDMAVRQEVFRKMLGLEQPFTAALYTRRTLDLEVYAEARAKGHSEDESRALASTFTVNNPPREIRVVKGFIEVEQIGTGVMLIAREVLEKMVEAGIAGRVEGGNVANRFGDTHSFDFFSYIENEKGNYLSEDFSFCKRARQIEGMKIWGFTGPGVGHVGSFEYGAPFIDFLRAKAVSRS